MACSLIVMECLGRVVYITSSTSKPRGEAQAQFNHSRIQIEDIEDIPYPLTPSPNTIIHPSLKHTHTPRLQSIVTNRNPPQFPSPNPNPNPSPFTTPHPHENQRVQAHKTPRTVASTPFYPWDDQTPLNAIDRQTPKTKNAHDLLHTRATRETSSVQWLTRRSLSSSNHLRRRRTGRHAR